MLLPLSLDKFAMPWPTSIPGSRITTGPHPSLGDRELSARKTMLSGACADILSFEAPTVVQAQFVHTKTRELMSAFYLRLFSNTTKKR